jgi:hypothetical protein
MKNKLFLTLFVLLSASTAWADVEINETNFPDENFRNWLLNESYGADGVLTEAEIAQVKNIGMPRHTSNLKGIEYFTSLESLGCSGFDGDEIDLSGFTTLKSFNCTEAYLKKLDVSGCTALTWLNCQDCRLTTINLSGCTALSSLYCERNHLETLDVSECTALKVLACSQNPLDALDLSKNTSLVSLSSFQTKLTTLDISACTALTYLDCYYNQLTTLNVSKNTELKNLDCRTNQLTELDVSKNTKLERFLCNNNLLKTLDVSKNLALPSLNCSNNQLTSLIVSKDSKLTILYCQKNNLKGTAMDALVENLPIVDNGKLYAINNEGESNVITNVQMAAAKEIGWTTYSYDGKNWQEYPGSEPSDPNFATLTYCAGEQSVVEIPVKKGEVKLRIGTQKEWGVETLTVDGNDRLSELADGKLTINVDGDTEVRATFCWANSDNLYFEDYATGVATIVGENVKVFAIDDKICVEGATGKTVRLYTLGGSLIKAVTPQDSEKVGVFLVPSGTYIVQVSNKGAKIVVK